MAEIQAHEAILFNSIISTAVQDELKQELKRLGYTDLAPSHFMLLYVVYKNGGRIQIKCICDTMLKQKSTITEMILRLVKSGYLVKEGHSEDKRVMYVVATKKALEVQKYFEEIFDHLTTKMFHGFSEEEKATSFTLLQKVLGNLS